MLYNFSKQHGLKINASKSFALIFGNKTIKNKVSTDDFILKIGDGNIPIVHEAKNLGIVLDSDLNFQTHISNKTRLAYSRLKRLYPYKNCMSSSVKYRLCESLVLSLFDYGDVVYNNSLSQMSCRLIQKVQNSCMRFSYNIPFRHHITPYLNNYSILNMKNRRTLHMYSFIAKILQSNEPKDLRSKFTYITHPHNTRFMQNYRVPPHQTAAYQKSFLYAAVHLWNSLSEHQKNLSLNTLKKYIRDLLLEEQKLPHRN